MVNHTIILAFTSLGLKKQSPFPCLQVLEGHLTEVPVKHLPGHEGSSCRPLQVMLRQQQIELDCFHFVQKGKFWQLGYVRGETKEQGPNEMQLMHARAWVNYSSSLVYHMVYCCQICFFRLCMYVCYVFRKFQPILPPRSQQQKRERRRYRAHTSVTQWF